MWLIISMCILFGVSGFWLKKGILVILDSWCFGHLVSKGKLVILLRGLFLVFYVWIIILTKLLVSWGNYLETLIIRYFDGLRVQ